MFKSPVSKIISADNKTFRECQKLLDKKYRDRWGLFLVEGENLVNEAAASGDTELVLISDAVDIAAPKGVDSVLIKDSLFKRLSQTETSQGIIAVVKKKQITSEDFTSLIGSEDSNVLVLDRLQDPGNIGTIIRTAEAAGYKGIITIKGTGDVTSPKVVRAAAGSVLRMPFLMVEDAKQAAQIVKESGKKLIGTSIRNALPFYEADMSSNIALIIGNEGKGMSEEFAQLTDINVTIPMKGDAESLNAAVAAGIIMFSRA